MGKTSLKLIGLEFNSGSECIEPIKVSYKDNYFNKILYNNLIYVLRIGKSNFDRHFRPGTYNGSKHGSFVKFYCTFFFW